METNAAEYLTWQSWNMQRGVGSAQSGPIMTEITLELFAIFEVAAHMLWSFNA